jgi:glycosyltransferase involved in cell wall biosynthesis
LTPELTVVVCTRNRAELLFDCLDSVVSDRSPGVCLEVVVVDNGSTDDTAAVVAARPSVRYVVEPVAGLSRARNAGLAAATGALVAFLDDDARPDRGWASAIVDAGRRWPEASAFGGPVRLEWIGRRPYWLVPELERWFSAIDHGPTARLLQSGEYPVGANLVVRRDEALAVGGFSLELGRVDGSLISEEETELLQRLVGPIGWAPDAGVRHLVAGGRTRCRWLLRRAWAQGRSEAISARLQGEARTAGSRARSRDVAGAVARYWPTTVRNVWGADRRGGELLRDLVDRGRRIGRATARRGRTTVSGQVMSS